MSIEKQMDRLHRERLEQQRREADNYRRSRSGRARRIGVAIVMLTLTAQPLIFIPWTWTLLDAAHFLAGGIPLPIIAALWTLSGWKLADQLVTRI